MQFKDVRLTDEGVGAHYSWTAKVAGVRIEGFNVFTEYVANRRIIDTSSSSTKGTWTYSLEPDGSGTRLAVPHQVRSFWRLRPWSPCWTDSLPRRIAPRFAWLKVMLEK